MNSRQKGKVGEREFAALLREHGFDARRGQQFAGGAASPDVVSEALAWLHFEVKRTQALNLADACAQAEGDAGGKPWAVAHRRNHAPWLITLRAELFFELVREWSPASQGEPRGRVGSGHEEAQKTQTGLRELRELTPIETADEGGSTRVEIHPEAWVGEANAENRKAVTE